MINKNTFLNRNIYFKVFETAYNLLNKNEKHKLKINIIISFIAGFLEILSATIFFPLVSVIIEPEVIKTNNLINNIWVIFGRPDDINFIYGLSILIIVILATSTFINLFSQASAVKEASNAQERFAKELYKKIIYSPYEWHIKNNPNLIRNVFLNNLQLWNKSVIRSIPFISGQVSGILCATLTLLFTTPKLGLVLIIISTFILSILLKIIRKKTSKLMGKVRENEELINIFMTETLNGIKDIKLSSREKNFIGNFYKLNHTIIKNYASASKWNLLPTYTVILIGQLSILITTLILFSVGIRGGELAAIMAIIVIVFSRVIPMFNRLGSSLNNIANLEKWMDRIYLTQKNLRLPNDFLNQDTEIADYRFNWDKVKFSSVKFIYPESNNIVFQNLNFEIKKGLHYAFVGYSGSGKTTAIDLFLGLLQPTEGNIFIDDKDLKEVGSKRWQRKIKYVPQKPLITSGSLRENIAFGYDKEKIDDERVIYCLKQTQIYEMAKQLSSGIYTNLGNDAITLSGGQKQRVAISRALYSNPDILILDEATSSLDAETEKIIQKTIKKLSKSITIISIAHRFSTIKNCDYIFLFNKGKITAKGDYDSLITTSKLFKKLSS